MEPAGPSSPATPDGPVPRIDHVDAGIGDSINPHLLTPRQRIPVVVLESIAIWNCLELFFIIFFTLRRRHGCYFWSLLVATAGIPILATANILNNLGLTKNRILVALLILLGWMPMVVGQAFVLYSRLHLMYLTRCSLRLVLAMIITVAVVTSVPAWVLVIASNAPSPLAHRFLVPYSIYEKVQVVIYCLQESCLSTIYLWKCYQFWSEDKLRAAAKIRAMLIHLFFVHIVILCLDISIIYFEWSGDYLIQTSYKAFVYSVKLKVEISILSSLGNLVREKKLVEIQSRTRQQIEEEWTQMLDINIERGHQMHKQALMTSVRAHRNSHEDEDDDNDKVVVTSPSTPPPSFENVKPPRSSDSDMAESSKVAAAAKTKGCRGIRCRPAALPTFWEMASFSSGKRGSNSGTQCSGDTGRSSSGRHRPL